MRSMPHIDVSGLRIEEQEIDSPHTERAPGVRRNQLKSREGTRPIEDRPLIQGSRPRTGVEYIKRACLSRGESSLYGRISQDKPRCLQGNVGYLKPSS